jgi:hypothetical protein
MGGTVSGRILGYLTFRGDKVSLWIVEYVKNQKSKIIAHFSGLIGIHGNKAVVP